MGPSRSWRQQGGTRDPTIWAPEPDCLVTGRVLARKSGKALAISPRAVRPLSSQPLLRCFVLGLWLAHFFNVSAPQNLARGYPSSLSLFILFPLWSSISVQVCVDTDAAGEMHVERKKKNCRAGLSLFPFFLSACLGIGLRDFDLPASST